LVRAALADFLKEGGTGAATEWKVTDNQRLSKMVGG
jgi:hypothetical protein